MGNGETSVLVLEGRGPEGLRWELYASEDPDGQFLTEIWRQQGEYVARSGAKGTKLYPGKLVNYSIGKADGTPEFVIARAAPEVRSVTAVGLNGDEYPLILTDVFEQFSLRFGATPIPDHDDVVEVRTDPPTAVPQPRRNYRQMPRGFTPTSGWFSGDR